MRERDQSITYGGLVSMIPDAYHLNYTHFRLSESVIKRRLVTLVLPNVQPWEFNMLPQPNAIRMSKCRASQVGHAPNCQKG